MNRLRDVARTEPVRLFSVLAALVPLVLNGLELFNVVALTGDQIAYLNALPIAIGAAVGVTVVRNQVTPVAALPRTLDDHAIEADNPLDRQFLAVTGDPHIHFVPLWGQIESVQLETPRDLEDIDLVDSVELVKRADDSLWWKIELPPWPEAGRYWLTVLQGPDGDHVTQRYQIDVHDAGPRPDLIG